MENLNLKLEKYFRGETTLDEEDELKQYFKSENVLPEYEMYRAIFQTFEHEAAEKAIAPVKIIRAQKPKRKRIWIQTFAYIGAASLLLTFWVKFPQQSDNYAIVGGEKIQDSEYAERYAAKKLNQVHDILNRGMQPMQNIEVVRRNLQPIQKLYNVKEKINEIQNVIQFK